MKQRFSDVPKKLTEILNAWAKQPAPNGVRIM